jgi:hypothetical protein
MSDDFSWLPPPLDSDEEQLVKLYLQANCSLDALPYTAEFERLVKEYRHEDTREARHEVFMKLLRLRKQGRLPRISSAKL